MDATYRAVEVSKPGQLSLVQKPLRDPGTGHVRIRIEACGVCHSDSATVEGVFPGIVYPRVPGHEVVGRIEALGPGVQGWANGQRVGVGFLGGFCGYCEFCRSGDLVNCRNQEQTGIHHDGGYAEVMIAKATGLMSIPNELSSVDAAPLLCAGLTTFSAHYETRRRRPAILSQCSVSEVLVTWACNMRATWASRWRRLLEVSIRPNWRRNSAPTISSTALQPMRARRFKHSAAQRSF